MRTVPEPHTDCSSQYGSESGSLAMCGTMHYYWWKPDCRVPANLESYEKSGNFVGGQGSQGI